MDSQTIVGLFLGVFALVGSRRGISRELLALMGILLAILLSSTVAEKARPQVNRLYRYGRAGTSIMLGASDPGEEFAKASKAPDLVNDRNATRFHLIVFLLFVLFSYILGQIQIPAPTTLLPRLLGVFVGGVNGYAIASYVLPTMIPKDLTLRVPAVEARSLLTEGETVARVLFFFVVVLIIFGLWSASSARKKR
jgi:uncharacterized membrane protein required for colicin V production